VFDEAETCLEVEQEELQSEDTTVVKQHSRKKGRKPLPQDLPRHEIIYDLTEAEKICSCGCQLSQIGSEVSEQLDYIPASLRVLVHRRYKYACKSCEDTVKSAPVPIKPLPKSNASASLLAHTLVSKFADHLPLYRQAMMFKRLDIDIARNSLCNWVIGCGQLFTPLIKLLQAEIISSDYVASDETPLRVLSSERSKCYMWVHLSGNRKKRAVVYDYHESRSGSCASDFLAGFKGYHQCDAYSGYNALHESEDVTWVGCWGHARRKYIEITKIIKTHGVAHHMVGYIGQLYKIEREILDKSLDPRQTKELRLEKSGLILTRIEQFLGDCRDKVAPQSTLGRAVAYTVNNWQGLQTYLQDGRLRIDNNDSERMIKPFAVGRKNWLFCATNRGAEASANIYSLIETCKANGVNAYEYLRYILSNIRNCTSPELLRPLLPYNVDKKLLIQQ
jgi:transposase